MHLARSLLLACCFAAPLGGLVAGGCGGHTTSSGIDPSANLPDARFVDHARIDGAYHPQASCLVTIDTPLIDPTQHVPIGTEVPYGSNPPSSGSHYPIWAAFQEFQTPVDRRYYVHDLEHGAVVFLYKCPGMAPASDGGDEASVDASSATDGGRDPACEALVEGLRKAVAALPTDPLCDVDAGVRVRAIITPDPLIPTPIAATAWGNTYTAECVDLPTLISWAKGHYGQGPEATCVNGVTAF